MVTSLAGEFNDPEWNSVSNSSPSAILDAAIANGMSDWTSATRAIALLPLSDQSTYLSSISPDLSNGINSLAQDFADGAAATFMTVHKDLPAATPPAPGTGQPAPPSSGGPNGQSFASALSNFNYGSGQAADDGWGDASLNTIAGDSANGVSAKSYAIGSDASLHLGSSLSFGGGQMTTVVQEVAPGSSENATGAYDAVWNDSVAGSSLTQALSNVKGATFHTCPAPRGSPAFHSFRIRRPERSLPPMLLSLRPEHQAVLHKPLAMCATTILPIPTVTISQRSPPLVACHMAA